MCDVLSNLLQTDSYGEDVRGFTEALGVTVVNETSMVGVQKSKTTISQITSDKIGRSIKVRPAPIIDANSNAP